MGILIFLILLPFIFILGILLPLIAIIDIIRSRFPGNDALLMVLLVVFVPFGSIIYFLVAPSRKIKEYNI